MPIHIVDALADMITLTGCNAFTVIIKLLLVAGLFDVHVAISEVISTITRSPFAKVVVVNAGLFVPALIPFTFH